MTDRAREEIAQELYGWEGDYGSYSGYTWDDIPSLWEGKVAARERADIILKTEVNGYTIKRLIGMAEKATEGERVGVYCEDAELPKVWQYYDNFVGEEMRRIHKDAQEQMLNEGYRKIIKEE